MSREQLLKILKTIVFFSVTCYVIYFMSIVGLAFYLLFHGTLNISYMGSFAFAYLIETYALFLINSRKFDIDNALDKLDRM